MNEIHHKAVAAATKLADDHATDETLLLALIVIQLADLSESLARIGTPPVSG